jgi:hypothetical protein
VTNIISFNVGVELGQLLALSAVLVGMTGWRRRPGFVRHAAITSFFVLVAGFALAEYQFAGYFLGAGR